MKKNLSISSVLLLILNMVALAGPQLKDSVTVNKPPVISIIAPSNGTTFTAPASFTINVNATDADGTISKVEFYNGSILLNTITASPYSFNWSNVMAGTYSITTKAIDDVGEVTVSSAVKINVSNDAIPNQAPSVSLTVPLAKASYAAPANITISADAFDPDGTISKVDFFCNALLLGSDHTAPYSYTWTNVSAGTYTIFAVATDDQGATRTSVASVVTVLSVATDACASIPMYIENENYTAGSKVKSDNKRYECKPWPYSVWCNGAAWAYAPGAGAYWTDAWNMVGSCNAQQLVIDASTIDSLNILTASPNPFVAFVTIEIIVAESGNVSLKLFDKTGQAVESLIDGYLAAGTYHFANHQSLKTGMYLLKYNTDKGMVASKTLQAQ